MPIRHGLVPNVKLITKKLLDHNAVFEQFFVIISNKSSVLSKHILEEIALGSNPPRSRVVRRAQRIRGFLMRRRLNIALICIRSF